MCGSLLGTITREKNVATAEAVRDFRFAEWWTKGGAAEMAHKMWQDWYRAGLVSQLRAPAEFFQGVGDLTEVAWMQAQKAL